MKSIELGYSSLNGFALPPMIVGVLIALFGFAVLIRERATLMSILFWLLSNCVAFWLLCFSVSYLFDGLNISLILLKLGTSIVIFIPTLFYAFSRVAVGQLRRARFSVLTSALVSCLFFILFYLTDSFILGARSFAWGWYPKYGPLSVPFLVFFFLLATMSLRIHWTQFQREPEGMQKQRFKVFFIAFSIAHLGSVDYLPAYGVTVYPSGYIAIFVYMLLMVFGIWRYRLVPITSAFAADEIVKTVADTLLVIDPAGIIRVANNAATRFFEKKHDDLIGFPARNMGVRFFKNADYKRPLWARNVHGYEDVWTNPKGVKRDVEISSSVIRDRRGVVLASVCIIKDITNRKKNEKALADREKHYRLLAENISDVLWTMDPQLKFTYFSPSIEKLTGFTPEEALEFTLEQSLTPNSFKSAVFLLTQEQARQNAEKTIELEFNTKEGKTVPTEARITLLYDKEGTVIELIGVTRDITERKKVESALSASERSYTELVKDSNEPILMVDRLGLLQMLNPAAEIALGYTSAEVMKKHIEIILDRESIAKTLQEMTLVFLGWMRPPFEFHMRRRDGSRLVMQAVPKLVRKESEGAFMQILFRELHRGSSETPPLSA